MSDHHEDRMSRPSRRGFIAGSAVAAAGLTLLRPGAIHGQEALPPVGSWPWPEAGLDAVATARGDTSALKGCATVTFGLIIAELSNVLGPDVPWAKVPAQMASAFNGGGPYGSDCGGLQGGLLAMNLVGAPITLKREYYQWYCNFPFPSTEWDDLYSSTDTIQTVSGSPLCHESRSKWEGEFLRHVYSVTGEYDSTRCSKLPRDCTKKCVELINAFKLDQYPGYWSPEAEFEECYNCHTDLYKDKLPGGINSGKEDCNGCHTVSKGHPRRKGGKRL